MSHPVKAKLLLDRSSGVVFIPIAFQGNIAIAGDGNQYEIENCQPATPELFDQARILIGDEGTEFLVHRGSKGLRIGRFWVALSDEISDAAKKLAEMFNGVVVSDVPPQFQIQEVSNDDW